MTAADAIVVGGGFAGLAAATALAEAGARVIVVEARRHFGGRATAYRDPVTGERIDNGQHVLAGCYDETLCFLRRLGRTNALRRPSTLDVVMIDESGTRHELRLPPLPAPFHLLAGVLAWRELTWSERAAIIRLGPTLHRLARRPADAPAHETVRAWLNRHRQPERLCRLFWEPLALATLNQSIDQASVVPFLAVVKRMMAGGPDAATLMVPAVLLDDLYAQPAGAFLVKHGANCHFGRRGRVRFRGDVVSGVAVGDYLFEAPVVISAVPWFALGSLFDVPPRSLHALMANASAMAASPIVTVNVWLDRSVMIDDFIGLPGRAFQWVFDKSRIVGEELTHLSLVSSGAESIVALDNDAVARRALHELQTALPGMRDAAVRRVSIVRERSATFSLAPAMPPRPQTQTALRGFLLAGDWIDTGLPATIESAVVSGHQAALVAARP